MATESSQSEILTFQEAESDHNNQLSSIFLGIPVADELFSLPVPVYMTPGFIFHHSSDVQDSTSEYVLAFKIYYTLDWTVAWRIGLAEGLSYAAKIPYVEKEKVEDKAKTPSRLMNYLDISVDVDLGKLFKTDSLEGLWLGWCIHHRSGIFSGSDAFNEISGRSNYNCLYMQYHW